MKGNAAGLLVVTLVAVLGGAAVTAQEESECPDGSACTVAVFCLRGERKFKRPCRLDNGVLGVCCAQKLTAEERAKVVETACIPEPDCRRVTQRYRTADGSCISERDARLGMSNTAYTRLLPAAYIDGEWSQPIKQPQPREISRLVFDDGDRPHPFLALTTSHWGQLLAHDLTLMSAQSSRNGDDIGCCRPDGSATATDIPPENEPFCSLRIGVRNSDPFYRSQVHCLNFVRAEISRAYCYRYGADSESVIRQVNQATHYLDASMVYGSSIEDQLQVRSGQGGRLKVQRERGGDFLPLGDDNNCAADAGGCFVAGDPRNNHVPALAALHTLLLREHNRIADRFAASNPSWDDETIFQEARLIVIAEVQHITYSEWLPGIVGMDAMDVVNRYIRAFGPSRHPPSRDYNPSISSEFAAAAFRFGHSTVDGRMNLRSRSESLRLPDFFHRSGRLREDGFFDGVIRWMVETPMQEVDRFVTTSLRGLLDNTTVLPGLPFGLDLVAFNIQRGRDAGLRRYIDYRFWFGMGPVNEWEDLQDVMEPSIIKLLKKAYENPGDVDLYVGGILENHVPGAAVGPTFQTILMEQFARTLMGDRDFYILSNKFNDRQIHQIRKASLSRLICDNADSISSVARNSFRIPDEETNTVVPCSQIPSVNLDFFNKR